MTAATATPTLATMAGQQGLDTRLESSVDVASKRQGAGDDIDFITAVILLSSAIFCVVLVVIVYTCVQKCSKRSSKSCCSCNFWKGTHSRDIEMGYLPANITVNQGAVQRGVPDIFLRGDTQSGRFSMEPPPLSGISYQISRDADSDNETSGTWAEFLRRATLRRSGRRLYGEGGADQPSDSAGAPPLTSEGPWMTSESLRVTSQGPGKVPQAQNSSPTATSVCPGKSVQSPLVIPDSSEATTTVDPGMSSDSPEMTTERAGVKTDKGSLPILSECLPPDPTRDVTEDGVDNEVFEEESFRDTQHLTG